MSNREFRILRLISAKGVDALLSQSLTSAYITVEVHVFTIWQIAGENKDRTHKNESREDGLTRA